MATASGEQLAENIRRKMIELEKACEEVDEVIASRSPPGRWSPKMILSHLAGPDGVGYMPMLRRILEEDTPLLGIEMENPYCTERRAGMAFYELLAEVTGEFERVADFAEDLSPEELGRKARVPMFKDTELGEYPTLGQFLYGIGDFHVQFHIDHLREVAKQIAEMPPRTTIPET